MDAPVAAPTDGVIGAEVPSEGRQNEAGATGRLVPFVVFLFFAWGFASVLIDTLIPKLKGLFALSYAEAMLTQFAFFIAYLIVSVPAGVLLARIGYMRGIAVGLGVMMLGCLLFSPAAALGRYELFLVALFIMAAGITTLQVAANPLIAVLGSPAKSHSRLNLAQAFNSLGTFIGPFVGAALILRGGVGTPDFGGLSGADLAARRQAEAAALQTPFLGIAAVLAVVTLAFWLLRNAPGAPSAARNETSLSSFRLLATRPRLALGALTIFVYVGAEVSIGSLLVNYLMDPKTLGAQAETAGRLVALYWGAAMLGRLIGSAVMLRVPAGAVLSACAIGAAVLTGLSAGTAGWLSATAIIAVGLFNSVIFPTTFTLAIEGLGRDTPQGSGLICMAIVGGAVIPLVAGVVADHGGLSLALIVPILCYAWIAAYGGLAGSGRIAPRAAA